MKGDYVSGKANQRIYNRRRQSGQREGSIRSVTSFWYPFKNRIRVYLIRIRIQHFRLNTDPDPDTTRIRIQPGSRVLPKIEKIYSWKKKFFESKTTIYLSLGLRKGRPSCKRSLQPSKENIQHCRTWNFLTFILLLWVIFALLVPDPVLIRGSRERNPFYIHVCIWCHVATSESAPFSGGF
jgi:hypothetical protein